MLSIYLLLFSFFKNKNKNNAYQKSDCFLDPDLLL